MHLPPTKRPERFSTKSFASSVFSLQAVYTSIILSLSHPATSLI